MIATIYTQSVTASPVTAPPVEPEVMPTTEPSTPMPTRTPDRTPLTPLQPAPERRIEPSHTPPNDPDTCILHDYNLPPLNLQFG